tara:strand:- start:463 stop:834 length:372 start_codon:yes stop_codon:yes gene_type:complete
MKITKKRLKQIIKEELALLEEERQLLESQRPHNIPGIPGGPGGIPGLPGGNPLGAIDWKMFCGVKDQLLDHAEDLLDHDLADAAMDEIAKLLGLGWLEKTAFKAMAPNMVANIITNGFKAVGC